MSAVCTCYRGGLQALLLQLRLMALGLLMLEQKVRGTIFPSAFLLQPNLVYCFPEKKDNGQLLPWRYSLLLLRLPVVQTSSTRFGTVGPSLQSPLIEYGILCQKVGLQWRSKAVLDDIFIGHRDLGVALGMDLIGRNKRFRPKANSPSVWRCDDGDGLTMSRTPYFRGPVVWIDSFSAVLLYSHMTPFSITTRDTGCSSSLLRKRWLVSWFFTAGAGNNMGSHKTWSWVFGNELHLPPLTQDVRCPLELLDQQVPGSFGDFQDL